MEVAAEGRTVAATATPATGGGMGGGARSEPEGLPCPRCESTNTKFCYYNNYNLAQPRHFCKACRRYWTRGGALRNVPVGGGTRNKAALTVSTPASRRKRAAGALTAAQAAAVSTATLPLLPPPYELPPPPAFLQAPLPLMAMDPDRRLLNLGGSFASLLAAPPPPPPSSASHFATGFLLGTMASPAFSPSPSPSPTPSPAPPSLQPPVSSQPAPESIWAMGWPHLSI